MDVNIERLRYEVKIATLRGAFYGALARSLGPNVEELVAGTVLKELEVIRGSLPEVWEELAPVLSNLLKLDIPSTDELRLEYTRLFVKGECPPYNSSYVKRPFAEVAERAVVAGFYSAFGLKPQGEFPDHLVSELEFMGLLCLKEAHARSNHLTVDAKTCIEAERKFLSEHLSCWVSSFREKVKEASRNPTYPLLAELMCLFIAAEMSLVKAGESANAFFSFSQGAG